ncbi:cdkn1a interacting zinc finger protein 1a [Pholidichthys leucotaenia]
MFNPHIHQQQQQQQQLHQHLRQLRQLLQQPQPPPPPPPSPRPNVPHHRQTPRAIPVAPQTTPSARMVNLCQTTQTTILAPNPMLQGAILMQRMQGNMRSFRMGGQQFRQFFATGSRSSLLGPVPMGMSPMMGFPAARPFHPHPRYYNNTTTTTTSTFSSAKDTAARQPDRKRDSEQMATGSTDDQSASGSSTREAHGNTQTDGAVEGLDQLSHISEEQLVEPEVKKARTEGSEKHSISEAIPASDTDGEAVPSECNNSTEDFQAEDVIFVGCGDKGGADVAETLEESRLGEAHSLSASSPFGALSEGDQQVSVPEEEVSQVRDSPPSSPDNQEEEENVAEGSSKFYCYLCSITCHNQQNFKSHMNSISHQQRMMEIQHMSNACLVTLLPRVHESLQGANRDGEKKADLKRWCDTCHSHYTSSITDHRRTEQHKLASRMNISSCAVCKKHFKTSQMFLEHLQSQEHRQKLQDKGCEALAKLSDMDIGFSLEEQEGSEEDEEDRQDGWSSLKEVALKDMASDEQYDPDKVYGSSFLVPVAGFICRICNKFYHFDSSALHTHCKSLKHFENLKRYRASLSQKGDAAASSHESAQVADSLQPVTETTSCSSRNLLSDSTSLRPIIISEMKMPTGHQQNEKQEETEALATSSPTDEELDGTQTELLTDSGENSEPPAPCEDANDEEEEEVNESQAPSVKKNGTGRGRPTPRRRSGRATNRR